MPSDHTYCHRCGEVLGEEHVAGALRPKCGACGEVVFFDPKLAVVVIASQDSRILMVKRDIDPMMGRWSFPSGYVDRGEIVEEAAVREVREETNVEVSLDALLGRVLSPWRTCGAGGIRGQHRRRVPASRGRGHRRSSCSRLTTCLHCPSLTTNRSSPTGGRELGMENSEFGIGNVGAWNSQS